MPNGLDLPAMRTQPNNGLTDFLRNLSEAAFKLQFFFKCFT